jgi:galactose-1-phosphate uridylyltransferase
MKQEAMQKTHTQPSSATSSFVSTASQSPSTITSNHYKNSISEGQIDNQMIKMRLQNMQNQLQMKDYEIKVEKAKSKMGKFLFTDTLVHSN